MRAYASAVLALSSGADAYGPGCSFTMAAACSAPRLALSSRVHSGQVVRLVGRRIPRGDDVQLDRVAVNGHTVVFGEAGKDSAFMYGHGIALRFDSRRRLVVTVTSLRHQSARVVVLYHIIQPVATATRLAR
jgi:hypothetical protein